MKNSIRLSALKPCLEFEQIHKTKKCPEHNDICRNCKKINLFQCLN